MSTTRAGANANSEAVSSPFPPALAVRHLPAQDDAPWSRRASVCQGGRVFKQLEAEALHEELDRLVVVLDDHSDLLEVHERKADASDVGRRRER
jgi:hypothetical protein